MQAKTQAQREREQRQAQAWLESHGYAHEAKPMYSDVACLNDKRKADAKQAREALKRRNLGIFKRAEKKAEKPFEFLPEDRGFGRVGEAYVPNDKRTLPMLIKRKAKDGLKPVHSQADTRPLNKGKTDFVIRRRETSLEKSKRVAQEAAIRSDELNAMSYNSVGAREAIYIRPDLPEGWRKAHK